MKKKLLAFTVSLLMVLMTAVPAFADSVQYVYDQAGNIKQESEDNLNDLGDKIYKETGIAVVYVDYEGDKESSDYIDKISESYSGSCIIMIHNLKTNKVLTRPYGKAKKAFDDSRCDKLFDIYNEASTYAGGCEDYMKQAEKFLITSGYAKDNQSQEQATEETETTATEITEVEETTEATLPQEIPSQRIADRLVDKADLLTDAQEAQVLEELNELSQEKQKDVVIYFADHFNEATVADAADDYYDYNGFGYGPEREGILMYVCMDTRDIYFSTCGPETIGQFTDSNIQSMVGTVGSYLSNEDYIGACEKYMDEVDYYTVHHFNTVLSGIIFIILSIVGAVTGSTRVARERRKLVSVRYQYNADDYLKAGSYHCAYANETFIRTDVSRIYDPLPDDDDRSSGGSSTHVSSSGTTHGGGGGKF